MPSSSQWGYGIGPHLGLNAVPLQPRGPGGGRHHPPTDGGSVGGSKPGDGRKSLRHSKTIAPWECARRCESLPHGSRALATGSAGSISRDKTGAPAHAWAGTGHQQAAPRLSRGLSEEEQTEGPASCRGKETEQRGWHFLRSAPAPAPGSALCGSSRGHDIDSGEWPGEQLNVLIILSRAPKGLFPTPAFPKDVPMIKTQRTWVCGDHIGSRLKMRKLEGRCAFSKLPSD